MTPDQLHAYLAANPQPYASIPAEQRNLLRAQLRPDGPFTEQQQAWLADFYLLVGEKQLADMRAALPPGLDLPTRLTNKGALTLNANLLTDCMSEGDTWHAIAADLATLTMIYLEPEAFPQYEEPP
jgi:hypothetical protein